MTAALSKRKRGVAMVVGSVVLVAACGGTSDSADRSGSGTAVDAEGVGCRDDVRAAIGDWAAAGYSGSVAFIGGEEDCEVAFGQADRGGRSNTVDTVFSVGSITKAMTAAAVLQMVADGFVNLDDPAGVHVPELSDAAAEATIEQLLLHTSGLTGSHGVDHRPLSKADAITGLSELEPSFEPGTEFLYSNAGYSLLALVIDTVTKNGFRAYLTTRILVDGDGRAVAGFWDGEPGAPDPRAVGYLSGDGGPGVDGSFSGPHWALDGNGGVAMTAGSLARWTSDLFLGRVLSPEATELLTRLRFDQGDGTAELPGWVETGEFGETVFVASGGGGSIGHEATAVWLPESGRALVVAVNDSPLGEPQLALDLLPGLIAGAEIPRPAPKIAFAAADLEAAAGTYELPSGDRFIVTATETDLAVDPLGGDALDALLPIPPDLKERAAGHEAQALAFVEGETPEGERERQLIEEAAGPLSQTEVATTAFNGELTTYLVLSFESGTPDLVLSLVLNEQGGSEDIRLGGWPTIAFELDGGGGFVATGSPEGGRVTIRPTPDGLSLIGPSGETTAIRVGHD